MQKYFSGHNEESENSKKDEDSNAQIVENDQNDSTVMISYPNQTFLQILLFPLLAYMYNFVHLMLRILPFSFCKPYCMNDLCFNDKCVFH